MSGNGVPIGEDDLQGFIDGRLTGERREAVERYLAEKPEIGSRVALDRRHRDSLRAQLAGKLAEPVPARLRVANIRAAYRAARQRRIRSLAGAAAIFVLGAASGWLLGQLQFPAPDTIAVAHRAAAAYRTFAVEVAHPVEVDAGSEQHLLRWLSKRLGRPLAAPDLSQFGYRLIGGRLLPGSSGAAAQLMYEDGGGKRLTVYVQAQTGSATAFRFRRDGDASTFAWIDQGFGFAVTAPLGRDELLPIAEAVYRRLDDRRGAATGKRLSGSRTAYAICAGPPPSAAV